MFSNFVALLFYSRDYAHKAHLRTTSHAKHMALDAFYKQLPELTDRLVETYQGRTGAAAVIGEVSQDDDVLNPTQVLRFHLKIIESTRDRAIDQNDRPMQNIVDEICGLYLQTLYKLEAFA